MNWRTPLYWFFCKIGDPIWWPSLFGKCCYCQKVHGRFNSYKQVHVELGRGPEGLLHGLQEACQHDWEQLDATYQSANEPPVHYKVPRCKKCGKMYV